MIIRWQVRWQVLSGIPRIFLTLGAFIVHLGMWLEIVKFRIKWKQFDEITVLITRLSFNKLVLECVRLLF